LHAALLTTCLFALTAVCATQASLALGAARANLGRLLVALVLLAIYAHAFGAGFGGGRMGLFFLAGAIGFGLGGFCMLNALPRIGSTFGLLVVECAATVSTTALAWGFLGAGISKGQALGALLCLIGVVTALAPLRLPRLPRRTLLAGVGLALAAAAFQGVSWTLSKAAFSGVAASGAAMDPMSAAYQRLAGGFTVAVVIYLIQGVWLARRRATGGDDWLRRHPPSPRALGWVVANALAGPVFGVSCMLWAIREVGNPGLVQAVVATATLVSVPLARRLEQRVFGPQYFIGALVAISGVAVLVLRTG
jgi:drug/metabolite transporter (DMT)-like permease